MIEMFVAAGVLMEVMRASGEPCAAEWRSALGSNPLFTSGGVSAAAIWDDGTGPALYLGGGFEIAAGISANRVVKWDGETATALGSGITNGVVNTLLAYEGSATLPAGLYVGGDFLTAGGQSIRGVARWDGAQWNAVGNPINNFEVFALAVYDEGQGDRLFAGGAFLVPGLDPKYGIGRWSGSGNWSNVGAGTDGPIFSLHVHDDGNGKALYAGGEFSAAGAAPARNIARWNGSAWSPLGQGVGEASGNKVRAMTSYTTPSGPRLIVGGDFSIASGIRVESLAQWDGVSWALFAPGTFGDFRALAVIDDGLPGSPGLWAGGSHSLLAQGSADGITRWNGASWDPLPTNFFGTVLALSFFGPRGSPPSVYAFGGFHAPTNVDPLYSDAARFVDGAWHQVAFGPEDSVSDLLPVVEAGEPVLYIGGEFETIGGVVAQRVARWDGTSVAPLGAGFDDDVFALAMHDHGGGPVLHAAGDFTHSGAQAISRIAKWNGSAWTKLNDAVFSAAIERVASIDLDDGFGPQLYVAGIFPQHASGVPAPYLVKWNGAGWAAVGPPLNGAVYDVIAFDDGTGFGRELYIAGAFTQSLGSPVVRVARLRGGAWSTLTGITTGSVLALTSYQAPGWSAPQLIAGGDFTATGSLKWIVRWNGTAWVSTGSVVPNGIVTSFEVGTEATGAAPVLFAAGGFNTIGSSSQGSKIAKWNGTSWKGLEGTFKDSIGTLRLVPEWLDGPTLFAGGSFRTSPAGDSFLTVRSLCPPGCVGDLDSDGVVGGGDILVILGNWGTAGVGDVDSSGAVGASDITVVLGEWGLCNE